MPRSAATKRGYASDWDDFARWCARRGQPSLPTSGTAVAAYIDELAASRRVATVRRRVAAVRARHIDAALTPPTASVEVQSAVARAEWRNRNDHRMTVPLGVAELRDVSRAAPNDVGGTRDRALVLLGYGAGLAPGELANLQPTTSVSFPRA